MGVTELGKLIPDSIRKAVDFMQLSNRIIAMDAYNALYQFLASIRQPDGTPLMDTKGRITSHLSGLLYRTINFLENRIWPVYVFDGKPPEEKTLEIVRRRRVREEAMDKWVKLLEEGKREEARKYAQRALFLTDDMVEDAKKLLVLMGIPVVQAMADGEAQAAVIAKEGKAWAAGSQDYDSLLFGAPRLVRNLAITGRRKLPNKDEYVEIRPEIIELNEILRALKLKDRIQLIDLAVLLGTDLNPDGVPGIGPQRALKLIQEFGSLEKLLQGPLKNAQFPMDPLKIRDYFLNPPYNPNYAIEFRQSDERGIIEFLVHEHDFNEERVRNAIERLRKAMGKRRESTLDSFFG
ncbi:flap structure-specific endonuclease [Vulcanisaeta moutnovskia 768-28]|uniref:Flap endonuclease 1 n=1 Tax=Vulcanisaeta moutnovskia (strain 768-28) TaxID=985053 RepID=F0QXB1_VULM7|nr:flap endonuclease-1 [Vulcanisaeta moutnovskia]ADY01150.1 flap structure-specific endonuclease [Vulcanisaeta moutnovskia 768-28]